MTEANTVFHFENGPQSLSQPDLTQGFNSYMCSTSGYGKLLFLHELSPAHLSSRNVMYTSLFIFLPSESYLLKGTSVEREQPFA